MRGGAWPFSSAAVVPVSPEEAERIARKQRQEARASKLPDGVLASTGEKALKVASTVTLLASVAGNAPLVGPILSGVLGVVAQMARAKGFSQRSKRYAHEMTADVKLTSALITLLVALRKEKGLTFNTDSIKDAAADVGDQINSIQNPSSGIFTQVADIARAESMLNKLKEAMQELKNNVTTAYIAVDLEVARKGENMKNIVDDGTNEIKDAWEGYIAAQKPAVPVSQPPFPANPGLEPRNDDDYPDRSGGRRKTCKSRRRRSRKGKTFRRKRQ